MYRTGMEYILFGKPSVFNGRINMVHPEIEVYKPDNEPHGLRGIYTLPDKLRNKGISSKTIQQLVANLLAKVAYIPETLPNNVAGQFKLMNMREALVNIHMPENLTN